MKSKDISFGTFVVIIIIFALAVYFLKTFWWLLIGISLVLAGIIVYQRKKETVVLNQEAKEEVVEYTQTCPTCGAKIAIKKDVSVIKCEYCGETFLANEEIIKQLAKKEVKEKEAPKKLNLIPLAITFFILGAVGLVLNVTGFGESAKNNTVNNEQAIEGNQDEYTNIQTQSEKGEAAEITASEETIPAENSEVTQNEEKPKKTYRYDELQTLFLNIDNTVTEENLVSMIQENGLEYTKVEYNEFYKYRIARTHEIALQSRGEDGDHVSVHFDKDSGEITDASYFNYSAWKNCYSYGNRESIFEGTNTMEPTQWEGSDNLVQFIGTKDAPIEHGVAQTDKKWVYFDSLESMLHSIMDWA